MKNVFIRSRNIEEGNNNLQLLFINKCEPSLKTKLKGIKGMIGPITHNMELNS